jgi:uncharacterized membrane protein YdjX (TVP38/TMEM64 family)
VTLAALHPESLPVLLLLLFVDGATIASTSTVLVLTYGRYQPPWVIATAGALASALGSAIQLLIFRWALNTDHAWLRWLKPSRDKVDAALKSYPSASFLLLVLFRATPLPDAPLKIVAAVLRYPIALYALASLLGTVPYFFVLALIGKRFQFPLWVYAAGFGLVGLAALVNVLWRRRRPRDTGAAGETATNSQPPG